MLLALVQQLFLAKEIREFPLTTLYGAAGEGYFYFFYFIFFFIKFLRKQWVQNSLANINCTLGIR